MVVVIPRVVVVPVAVIPRIVVPVMIPRIDMPRAVVPRVIVVPRRVVSPVAAVAPVPVPVKPGVIPVGYDQTCPESNQDRLGRPVFVKDNVCRFLSFLLGVLAGYVLGRHKREIFA